jgi:hypothetical protein
VTVHVQLLDSSALPTLPRAWNATVEIFEQDGVTHATVYKDFNGDVAGANPLPRGAFAGTFGVHAADGSWTCWVVPGTYTVTVTRRNQAPVTATTIVAEPPPPVDPNANAPFYEKIHYTTVQKIVDNPTDVIVNGLDADAALLSIRNDEGRPDETGVTLYVDEGAATVVDGVAYWVSGFAQWHGVVSGNVPINGSGYLPYILRYDLANDEWLPSVNVPAPDGAPAWHQAPLSWNMSGFQAVLVPEYNAVTVVGGHLTSLPVVGDYVTFLYDASDTTLLARSDQPVDVMLDAGSIYKVYVGTGAHHPADTSGQPTDPTWLPLALRQSPPSGLATEIGWGFEGGYYGAIGSKVYFGGGDSNLFDDGSGVADGNGNKPWSSRAGRQLVSYDTETGQFTTHAVKPQGHDYGFWGVADGKLYCGSRTDVNRLDVYDPIADAWTDHNVDAAFTAVSAGFNDMAQGVQVGRFLYWPDMGVKLNLDADPTTTDAWVALSVIVWPAGLPVSGLLSFDEDAAVAVGQDGLIHYFVNAGGLTPPHAHWTLDPADDTWAFVDDAVGASRFYFSAVQTADGLWRFIGGGTDVQGELHPVDPVVTEHGAALAAAVAAGVLPFAGLRNPKTVLCSVSLSVAGNSHGDFAGDVAAPVDPVPAGWIVTPGPGGFIFVPAGLYWVEYHLRPDAVDDDGAWYETMLNVSGVDEGLPDYGITGNYKSSTDSTYPALASKVGTLAWCGRGFTLVFNPRLNSGNHQQAHDFSGSLKVTQLLAY